MKQLFCVDLKDYEENWPHSKRPSVRGIIWKENKLAMVHSKKYDYYKFPGGGIEGEEAHEATLIREVKEETGLTLKKYAYRGFITFVSNQWGTEYMHLFTATEYEGEIKECDEGNLEWVPKSRIQELNLWEGDKIFFRLLAEDAGFFTLKLCYDEDRLISYDIRRYEKE